MRIAVPACVFGCTFRVVVAASAAALSGAAASAAPFLNLESATSDAKAIVAAGGQADIVLLGDSLSFDERLSFRPYFTDRMQALYGNAGPGFYSFGTERIRFGEGWTSGVVSPADPEPRHGLDGLWLKALPSTPPPSGGQIASFWDKIQVHYVAEPGGGSVALSYPDPDGPGPGTVTPITTLNTHSAAREVRKFDHQFPPNVATYLHYQPDGSGPVTLLGMNRVNDAPGLRVHRASNGGWGVQQYLQRDSTFDDELRLLGTDVVMVAVGANDVNTPHDEYVQKLGQLVDRLEAAVPDAEILLISPYDFGHQYAGRMAGSIEAVAAAQGAGFINLYETAGDYAFFQRNGYLADGLHFTESGGGYVGNLLAQAFHTNGGSLVPEPGAAALLLAGATLALRRQPRRRK